MGRGVCGHLLAAWCRLHVFLQSKHSGQLCVMAHYDRNLIFISDDLQAPYFNKLLLENLPDQLQIFAVQCKILHDEKLWVFYETWRGCHFARFTMKHQVFVTPPYIVQSAPNFTFDKSPDLKTSTLAEHFSNQIHQHICPAVLQMASSTVHTV